MKQYAVIHAVAGLYEGYSDTTCEWFPTRDAALKHIKQHMTLMSEDKLMVHPERDGDEGVSYYLTEQATFARVFKSKPGRVDAAATKRIVPRSSAPPRTPSTRWAP